MHAQSGLSRELYPGPFKASQTACVYLVPGWHLLTDWHYAGEWMQNENNPLYKLSVQRLEIQLQATRKQKTEHSRKKRQKPNHRSNTASEQHLHVHWWRRGQNPPPSSNLLSFIPCDVFDGWRLWSVPGSAGTLMSTCGRPGWSRAARRRRREKHSLFNRERDHPGIPPLLCQSLSCLVATCTICLSTWATAEWQVPSENVAHDANARRACGLGKRRSWPSLFPTSSVTAEAGVMALSSPKNLFADIPSFCHPPKRSWQSDWRRQKRRQTSGWLTFDRRVSWRTHEIFSFF